MSGRGDEHERTSAGDERRPAERPARPPSPPPETDATGPVCEVCGGGMYERHCKIVCPICGYTRDCSDP